MRRRLISAVVIIAAVLGCCKFLRISSPADVEAYFEMAKECHPIWKRFALRQFSAGDSAAELIRRFPPNQREEFGRYGVYHYGAPLAFTGVSVIARDGKLLSAKTGSCTWQFTFFHAEDPELSRHYVAYYKEKRERWERERLQQPEK